MGKCIERRSATKEEVEAMLKEGGTIFIPMFPVTIKNRARKEVKEAEIRTGKKADGKRKH